MPPTFAQPVHSVASDLPARSTQVSWRHIDNPGSVASPPFHVVFVEMSRGGQSTLFNPLVNSPDKKHKETTRPTTGTNPPPNGAPVDDLPPSSAWREARRAVRDAQRAGRRSQAWRRWHGRGRRRGRTGAVRWGAGGGGARELMMMSFQEALVKRLEGRRAQSGPANRKGLNKKIEKCVFVSPDKEGSVRHFGKCFHDMWRP